MVPMLTCGLVRSNFAFATGGSSWTEMFSAVLTAGLCWSWEVKLCGASLPRALCGPAAGVLLAGGLGDDLLGHIGRDLGVGVEDHRVVRPALGPRPEVADVAEHLRQRDERLDDPGACPLLHGLDLAAAGVQVADHVAHVVLGRGDLDGH